MRRYIFIAAALLAFTGCGKDSNPEETTPAPLPTVAESSTEITTEDIPAVFKPDTADVRTYCVSLDAARNELLANYKDKIPEKLKSTFDANSGVLDECIEKAAKDLSPEEAEQLFNEMKKLEVFFCDTMAKEVGAGKEIQKVAKLATKGADYYFEKIREQQSEETSESVTDENGEIVTKKADKTKNDKTKDKDKEDTTEETTEKEEK
ncbi:MAG: hypothetical protein IJR59_07705 [Firmicutes bacterium]|nr:hypothetical protein [Bacillota bacterium]